VVGEGDPISFYQRGKSLELRFFEGMPYRLHWPGVEEGGQEILAKKKTDAVEGRYESPSKKATTNPVKQVRLFRRR
jgi:hypothetical protein